MEGRNIEQPRISVDGTEHTVRTAHKKITPGVNIITDWISQITEEGLVS